MKKLLLAGVAGAALVAACSANAADLGPRPAYKAPPPPPVVAPAYNWTGFYVGGHFGGGWARKAWEEKSESNGGFGDVCFSPLELEFDSVLPLCPFGLLSEAPGSAFGRFPTSVGSHNAIGPLGGFQAGFNWQPVGSHWVFGIEGQFSFADLKGDHQNSTSGASNLFFGKKEALLQPLPAFTVATNGTINDRFSTQVRDIATIAGRIGITSDVFDRTLFYIKGGAAWARDHYGVTSQFSASSCTQEEGIIRLLDGGGGPICSAINGNGLWSGNQNRWGWMAGIGLEFGLFGNWSAKIEYDYLGFGRRDVTLNGSTTATCVGPCSIFEGGVDPIITRTSAFSRTFSIDENIQVVKLGLNYRFGWWGKGKAPVVASY